MSKLTKLFLRPRRFATDSQLYRGFSGLRSLASIALREATGRAWHPTASGDALVADLVEEIAKRMPILDLGGPGLAVVATLREHTQAVTEFVWELHRRPNVDVVLQVGRSQLVLAGSTLLAVDAFVSGAKSVTARVGFADREDSIEVVFELWDWDEGFAIGPRRNLVARRIPERVVREQRLFEAGSASSARDLHRCKLVDEPDFPVDIVYTWVNNRDPAWRRMWSEATGHALDDDVAEGRSLDRFLNRDELRYSLRSVAQYAPWVNRVYVATNCAPPEWVNLDNPKLVWVDHDDFIPADALPTFSSHAIESRLQHIPGLANHFLYFNDDFFLTRRSTPGDFYYCNGVSKSFVEGYGTVIGDPNTDEPDYLNAARNGKRLLEGAFDCSVTSLHRHVPYALRRDVLVEMEQRFELPIARTTRSQFRSVDDISTVSFLYHHYAFLTHRAVYADSDSWLLKSKTPSYERKLVDLLSPKSRPLSICLNDGSGSARNPHWGRHVVEFLEAFFPRPSEFERA